MAKVQWSTGIDSVSGALSKPGKSGQHSCTKMLLATHRVAETTSSDCNRIYLRKKVKRSTPVRENEAVARELFKARAAWVKSRSQNLGSLAQDQEDFLAQKDAAQGAKTMKAYYWKLAKAQVTAQSLNG